VRFPNKAERKALRCADLEAKRQSGAVLTPHEKRALTIIDRDRQERETVRTAIAWNQGRAARIAAVGGPHPDTLNTAHRPEQQFAVLHEVDEFAGWAGAAILRDKFAAHVDATTKQALYKLRQHWPQYYRVFRARYHPAYERTQVEVARELGMPLITVKRYDTAARQWLRGYCRDAEAGR
jgi:hypothetical protein